MLDCVTHKVITKEQVYDIETVRTKCFHKNLDIDENYSAPDKPYFDKYQKCYFIHSSFVRDEI